MLNALLAGRTSCQPQRRDHFWAGVLDEGKPGLTFKWVFEGYDAPLDAIVLDAPSPPAAERLKEIKPGEYYTEVVNDGRPLPVPADLDELICHYLFGLSADDKAKFDRATFWLDMFSRQWTFSVSAAFGALVSAIEALTERGVAHQFDCPICSTPTMKCRAQLDGSKTSSNAMLPAPFRRAAETRCMPFDPASLTAARS